MKSIEGQQVDLHFAHLWRSTDRSQKSQVEIGAVILRLTRKWRGVILFPLSWWCRLATCKLNSNIFLFQFVCFKRAVVDSPMKSIEGQPLDLYSPHGEGPGKNKKSQWKKTGNSVGWLPDGKLFAVHLPVTFHVLTTRIIKIIWE
jgi:hypothetical protein